MNKFNIGDKVIVVKKVEKFDDGSKCKWLPMMKYSLQMKFEIINITDSAILLSNGFRYPSKSLELVQANKIDVNKVSDINEGNDNQGKKYDSDKIRTDLLSIDSIMGTARILTFGSKKYSERNWENGIYFGRVYGAALRHLFEWWNGVDIDIETNENHLHHASCCIHFLQHYVENKRKYNKFDNRPKRSK